MMFKGSFVAIITPFKRGNIDTDAIRKLVRFHLKSGTSGLVPCGTTGEAATLSPHEYTEVIRTVVEEARGKIPVICGVGTNATWKAVEQVESVVPLGVDGILSVVPYYNKPTQEGLFLHFREVCRASSVPVIVYNIPGRTGVNLLPSTLERIAKECKNAVGTKEASGNLDQASEIMRRLGNDFCVLSGDDSLTLPMMSVGAKGVISVVANICPRETAQMCGAYLKGDTKRARKLHLKLFPLIKALFLETNPIPIKTAVSLLGLCSEEVRLPLAPMSPKNKKLLSKALKDFGL